MSSTPYEGSGGGAGGKVRKRPFRRSAAASTPYDRPPSAVRGVAPPTTQRNGWLSRLVDPASRIIAGGAARLFSSVFGKQAPAAAFPAPRLPAPPLTEENLLSDEEVVEVVCPNSPCEIQKKEEKGGDNPDNSEKEEKGGDNPNNSGKDEVSELEQLFMQKTFTRAEFDYLTELIRSRTIGPGMTEPAGNNKEKEKGTGAVSYGNISTPRIGFTIPEEEVASPAEIAKAYMGSRPSKLCPSSLNLQSHVFREETTLPSNKQCAAKPSDTSGSIFRFSRVPEHPDNRYFTPRPRGRSAIYQMSRSPYFKVGTAADIKGEDGHAGPSTSSQWTAKSPMVSRGKQVLKRSSSVLDSEFGSLSSIRRVRQKSNAMSSLKDAIAPLSRNLLPSPLKHGTVGAQDAVNGDNKSLDENGPHVPPQSSEMARKILQQLDKLVPSPKEKSSEPKSIATVESPSKLTLDMLHGRALKSMEDIDSPKFVNSRSGDKPSATSESHPQTVPQKQEVQQNGPSKPAISRVKFASGIDGNVHVVTPPTDTKSGAKASGLPNSGSARVPLQEKPAFKISAPEDSVEIDDDDYNVGSSTGLSSNVKCTEEAEAEHKNIISDMRTSDKHLVSSSQSMPVTTSKLFSGLDGKTSDGPVDFSFSVTSVPSAISQSSTVPAMPIPVPEKMASDKEETPMFTFGSKHTTATIFSSEAGGPGGYGSGASLNAEPYLSTRKAVVASQPEGSDLDKDDKVQKAGQLFKSLGSSISDLSTSAAQPVFAFSASATPSLNNGSSNPKPSANVGSSISAAAGEIISIKSTSIATTTTPSSSSISSTAPIFSTVTTFQFGSNAAATGSSVSTTLDDCNLKDLETKAQPFSFTSITAGTSAISNGESSASSVTSGSSTLIITTPFTSASNVSTSLMTSSAFSSSGGNSSSLITPSLFSSTSGGSSTIASLPSSSMGTGPTSTSSSLFSSTFGSHSTFPLPSPFSSTGSSIFGFSSPAQPTSNSSFASNNAQTSSANAGAAAASVFDIRGTSSSSGISNLSQSTSQAILFSTAPLFGMTVSSSSSFSSSSFGSMTHSAKPFGSTSGFSLPSATGVSSSVSSSPFSTSVANLFSSSSQSSTTPTFGAASFGSSAPPTTFTFGVSRAASGSSPLPFGSSSGSAFSFTSGANISYTSAPSQPAFGMPPPIGFGSGSPQNDQMHVEDSMTDVTIQATVPSMPVFGQPASSPAAPPGFMFGSPSIPVGGQPVFQFGGHQNPVSQNPNPFQPAGNLELPPGGSFSLGSTGDDKANRKFVRVRRKTGRK